eukprot:TRINITY_DN64453_c0_g1_i1.p1 TRINITY_DN64453_c0_g1~~TRINITY_DN64453_c0_g1_i1.p1  ORF type:complete len:1103 (-),score=258.18 TRINITY_DN64453_c0_g1_i1:122-3430(-)
MRRLDAAASLALPPISPWEVLSDGEGWTVTERPVGGQRAKAQWTSPRRLVSTSPSKNTPVQQKSAHWGKSDFTSVKPKSARARSPVIRIPEKLRALVASDDTLAQTFDDSQNAGNAGDQVADNMLPNHVDGPVNLSMPPPSGKPVGGPSMKGKTVENWLNHTLGQASNKPEGSAVASAAAKQAQGLAQFGIDNAALERLGLDQQAAERVYRAMFVYSQGMHAVLQEAVGRAKNSSTALLVLWRAFQSVLEQAGQSDEHGNGESLADLVKRGNEEEKERVEGQFRDQINSLQSQLEKLGREHRALQEQLQRLKEDEMRLRNDSEMYRTEHESTEKKYEREIKLRSEAEVKYLDKVRHSEQLQEQLDHKTAEAEDLSTKLREEMYANTQAKQDLDAANSTIKVLEGQVMQLRQQVQEGILYKQRMEQQVGVLKQQMDRVGAKTAELQDLLDVEQEANKKLTDQLSVHQRDMRRLEREYEDEQHVRKELDNERNLLREKVERMDKDISELVDERRHLQKQYNDLKLEHRTIQIELKRKNEQLDRTDKSLELLRVNHKELQEVHRAMTVENDNLREDVFQLDSQVSKEAELRKSLQHEKRALTSQAQALQVQLETSQLAVQSTQRELQEMTEGKVKLESVLRDTKSAMQKTQLEQQVEQKANAQKVAMLEKVIADERTERRNLVAETQDVTNRRDETLEELRQAKLEIGDLRRHRLEKEEAVDRLKVLLKAEEQRNSEQLVTVDKYHAVVAAHEAETRQIQVLLECERQEAARQHAELQDSFAAARLTFEQRIEHWKYSYEDLRSQISFNEASLKIAPLEKQVKNLQEQIEKLIAQLQQEQQKTLVYQDESKRKDQRIVELEAKCGEAEQERDEWHERFDNVLPDLERKGMSCEDAWHSYERIRHSTEVFAQIKAELERQLTAAKAEAKRLVESMQRSQADASTQVVILNSTSTAQTDLSYQYLETADHMQESRWRRDRLDTLKRASKFVEDAHEQRDFTVQMGSTAPPVARLAPDQQSKYAQVVDLKLEKSALVVGAPGGRRSLTGQASPAVPEPWPNARPPGAAPPVGSQKIQAMRRSYPSQGLPMQGGIQVSQVKTAARASMS